MILKNYIDMKRSQCPFHISELEQRSHHKIRVISLAQPAEPLAAP